jgi:hypothetical protein
LTLATVTCSRRRSAGVEKGNSSGWNYGRIERVFGGAIGGGVQGGVAGVLRWLGTATSEANWRGAGSSSAMRFKEKKRMSRPTEALSTRRNR